MPYPFSSKIIRAYTKISIFLQLLKIMKCMNRIILLLVVVLNSSFSLTAQKDRWQQRVEYKMEINMDAKANQFSGTQELKYFNNSPDTLYRVFFHLYFNAFQPGSMMDVRSRTINDPDRRVKDRIYHLDEDEIGYQKIKSMDQDGATLNYAIDGTVMTVLLSKPILPGSTTLFTMSFDAQVPLQVRRNGRDSKEGIRLSMAQWYPKIAEYDYSGWHAYDYVGREFYSPWGDYDVKITIDSDYVIGASGILQNPEEIGKGYAKSKPKGDRLTYHFIAENVHDFAWAADPDYTHTIVNIREGLDFHFFYQTDTLKKNWVEMEDYVKKVVPFLEAKCGKYPYPVYSVVQGGDGGMEYPMLTLIKGHRSLKSLVSVTVHEFVHSWYQMILGTNESYLYWMDEGFNTYYSRQAMDFLFNENYPDEDVYKSARKSYKRVVDKGTEEPLTTHADHFETNGAYSMAAHTKGALALNHLSYLMGQEKFDKAMLRYYNDWKFRHPNAIDFELIMEKESGMELSWFFDYWTKTTKTIDYSIKNVSEENGKSKIELEKIGLMPMPIDLVIKLKDGSEQKYYIPLGMMRAKRALADDEILLSNWKWVNPLYTFFVNIRKEDILNIEIDPSKRLSDIEMDNNIYPNKRMEVEIRGKEEILNNIN